jgi:hypothetical protein
VIKYCPMKENTGRGGKAPRVVQPFVPLSPLTEPWYTLDTRWPSRNVSGHSIGEGKHSAPAENRSLVVQSVDRHFIGCFITVKRGSSMLFMCSRGGQV